MYTSGQINLIFYSAPRIRSHPISTDLLPFLLFSSLVAFFTKVQSNGRNQIIFHPIFLKIILLMKIWEKLFKSNETVDALPTPGRRFYYKLARVHSSPFYQKKISHFFLSRYFFNYYTALEHI